jgi:hypothetical protein
MGQLRSLDLPFLGVSNSPKAVSAFTGVSVDLGSQLVVYLVLAIFRDAGRVCPA